jgi:hypothetical protein
MPASLFTSALLFVIVHDFSLDFFAKLFFHFWTEVWDSAKIHSPAIAQHLPSTVRRPRRSALLFVIVHDFSLVFFAKLFFHFWTEVWECTKIHSPAIAQHLPSTVRRPRRAR